VGGRVSGCHGDLGALFAVFGRSVYLADVLDDSEVFDSRSRLTDVIGLGVLTRLVHRDLVDEVIAKTGRREARSRLLPARVVVYLVLALCLFTADGYEEVVRKLTNGLRGLRIWRDEWKVPVPSAISKARTRLGAEPLAELFGRVCVPVARPSTPGAFYAGLRVMAIDGVILDVADTPENEAAFHRRNAGTARAGAFPQVRIVSLTECGTHASVWAEFDTWKVGERTLAARMTGQFTTGMLVLADRGFYSYDFWKESLAGGAQLLWRVPNNLDLPVLGVLTDGSYSSELVPGQIKAAIKAGGRASRADGLRISVRVIEYMITNRGESETIRLITSIADHNLAPAVELAAVYAQRWEHELTFDEIETHQMHPGRVLRSRTPDLVRQEVWALLITHYAVRAFITEAADDLGADPDRYSFTRTINVIRRQVLNQAALSPLNTPQSDS
jgi:Insertion element 4 transposase N-terminal/Transposase DDE domain